MGFFDEMIDSRWLERRPTRQGDAAWLGPPHTEIPHRFDPEMALVATDDLDIRVSSASVYGCGVALDLEIRWTFGRRIALPLIPGTRGRDGLCVGAVWDDGERLLALTRERVRAAEAPERALVAAPLRMRPNLVGIELWLWPRSDRDITVIMEWRGQRITECRGVLRASSVLVAARQVVTLWRHPAEARDPRPLIGH